MFVLGGQAPTPAEVAEVAAVSAAEAQAEAPDPVAAALEWDREASAEPWQVDVTREFDDTTRMGNSLSAAVRLELLMSSYREQVQDTQPARTDPVSGAELDPVDGLPLPAEDEAGHLPTLGEMYAAEGSSLAAVWEPPPAWETVADLEAEAAPLVYAAPAPEPPAHLTHTIADEAPDLIVTIEPDTSGWDAGIAAAQEAVPKSSSSHDPVTAVPMTGEASRSFGGAPARVLNWTSRHDPKSLEFGVRARLRAPAPLVDLVWRAGPILDQGTAPPLSLHDASGCTGHAGVNAANVLELAAVGRHGEVAAADLLGGADAMRLYERAQELDEVPGEAYPGTSILAVMKAGQEAGLWGTYLWAFGTRDVAQAILQVGPVIVGIPWLSQMAEPGPDGIVTVAGEPQGGHALCLHAIRMRVAGRAGPWFGALQTWGTKIGDGGVIWLHHKDLGRLLRGQGEAAIPLAEVTT
jgi:hypothetical protein